MNTRKSKPRMIAQKDLKPVLYEAWTLVCCVHVFACVMRMQALTHNVQNIKAQSFDIMYSDRNLTTAQ